MKRRESKAKEKDIKQRAVFRKLLAQCRPHLFYVIIGGVSSLIHGGVIPIFSIAFGNILSLLTDVLAN
jgi:hypothetical protein